MKSCSGKPCCDNGDCHYCDMADGLDDNTNIEKGKSCLWSSPDGIRCRLGESKLSDSPCEICLAYTPKTKTGDRG